MSGVESLSSKKKWKREREVLVSFVRGVESSRDFRKGGFHCSDKAGAAELAFQLWKPSEKENYHILSSVDASIQSLA
ncbi:hypothetical protein COLO4_34112 [Corchorus olitorius]|uniref:Uncharacterized protein n=1 Tax=Corchorus olitorius TaxID=93759 RepID=A0A1R3GNL6_9ROSI|nr:hypothetical protein COLO4_34112 [Corchorus olitorius]